MRNKILINGLIVGCAFAAGVVVTMKPWHVYSKLNAQSQKKVEEMNRSESHRIQLMADEDRAQSSVGREEAVRKAGYIGKGEVVLASDRK